MNEIIESVLPPDSVLRERLLALSDLYAGADARLAAFARVSPFRCPPGCGRCSATFEPDVLPVEAAYVVLYAIAHEISLQATSAGPGPRCPLYREDSDAHCPVYPARPLVCRLFGFSSLPNKTGALVYTACEHMSGAGPRSLLLEALGLPDDSLPPSMLDFSTRLTLIAPGEETRRLPLGVALREAQNKIGLYQALMKKDVTLSLSKGDRQWRPI